MASTALADSDQGAFTGQEATILQLMLEHIVPASNTLWTLNDPQTDEEWDTLYKASVQLVEAFEITRLGGSGPNDNDWASQDQFQAFIDQEMEALSAAQSAINARDIEALFEANDALYMPCESCHIDYNPRVRGN